MLSCPECDKFLRADAYKCVCGWSRPSGSSSSEPRRDHIDCAYTTCRQCADCRVWTKAGWATVCLAHYPQIDIVQRVVTNRHCEEVRAAYARSPAKLTHDAQPRWTMKTMKNLLPKLAAQPRDVEVQI